MTLWETLEQHLSTHGTTKFDSVALAKHMRISRPHASRLIHAYLNAQRRPRSQTTYVLSRRGRTSSAIWHVGVRTNDARALTAQCVDDIGTTIRDALIPDLDRMADLNPRCTALVQAIEAAVIANVNLLVAAIP